MKRRDGEPVTLYLARVKGSRVVVDEVEATVSLEGRGWTITTGNHVRIEDNPEGSLFATTRQGAVSKALFSAQLEALDREKRVAWAEEVLAGAESEHASSRYVVKLLEIALERQS